MRIFKLKKAYCYALVLLFAFTNITSTKAQTTLTAGDIAFTGYQGFGASATPDEFSFVLLAPVTTGTVINFTDNGWLSTNVFRTGETTVTWTAASALSAGTEVKIVGTTATLAGPGSPGTVTGTALSLSANGDQILAYQGTAASPTFITAIHMNVYSVSGSDPAPNTNTTAWDGTANTVNSSALPTGLTNGTNAMWIGTFDVTSSEKDNARFICAGDLSTAASIKTLIFDQTKWTTSDGDPSGITLPTGCAYIAAVPAPSFTLQPIAASICEAANASFTITATGATSYQWQIDNGGGFVNITNDATYSGATTTTLNITAAPLSLNTYQYRCVATNGGGSTNSNAATLTVNALPTSPTLLAKMPSTATVADGTPVSATFNAGSGGTGCADDYRYTTNGGVSYLPYTPGSNISTTGLAAGGGTVTIEGRRANCSAGCQGVYIALASWIVTPLPGAASTLNAGDIAFSSYAAVTDEFSFVLLRNIGPGTVINFTNNGWLSTNVFRTGEETVTWTSNAAYSAGTEIHISGLTANLASGGSAGTITGTALLLSINGDQILAYRGSAASPTFISAIHMNVYSTVGGDPAPSTTAAAWDGSGANTQNGSALPTGLTTGVNCIWIGTQNVSASEFENARYGNCANPATYGPIGTLRAALNNQANWIRNNNSPTPGFAIPTGCSYLGIGNPPNISGQPASVSICQNTNTTFTLTSTGASSFQWQVDNGGGFANITDNATYSGATTTALTITSAPISFNSYQYRCILSNGSGTATSNNATLTVTALPINPALSAKTPLSATVADGTPVSATFTAGSGGTGCSDDYRYTTDGGTTYLPYTPGSNISTTGLAAGSGTVFIEGRRANCSAGCQGTYVVLASWIVTPLPVAATTLNAGDIGFSSYAAATDEFSFVLLRNIGPGTAINFTNNGWLSTNVFRTGEETVTWTVPSGGLSAGTEIKIAGLTATKSGGGAAGTVTGTALGLNISGDQILAYRGTAASPTFISAIHMNVRSTLVGDPAPSTTAAAWDGSANFVTSSALPTGLTTGVNAIWIGTQDVSLSEFDNAAYGNCSGPGVLGPITGLRAALNNQANWVRNNNTVPGFAIPTACNYLSLLVPSINVTGTPLTAFTTCSGTASAEQNFVVSGAALTTDIVITAPAGFEISTTSGSGFASSVTLTQSGGAVSNTTIYVRLAASATGTPSGNITVASTGVTTINVAVSGTVSNLPTTANAGADASVCALTTTLAGNTATSGTGTWTQVSGPGTTTFTDATQPNSGTTVTVQGVYTYRWTISNTGCPSSQDEVTITYSSTPPVADAGADRNLCLPSSSLNLAGNAPAPGTGTWTQVSGPVTASITNTTSPTTSVSGLNTAGVYTFVWTITNAPCLPSTDTMTVTVSVAPAFFNVVGGNACQGSTITLAGAVDPNYTYSWARSLSGINGTFVAFGGTAQTQAVTVSGNYQLTTTNQFGCTMVDTAVVHIGDYMFNGSLAAGDATLTNRINRFGQVSTCAAPKACPGVFSGPGARLYDSYQIINKQNTPVCATIGLASSCGTNIFNVAYLKSFDPANPCTNYLADPGSSFPSSGFMEVTIPANDTIIVVVHEVNGGTNCGGYLLSVDLPRDPASISVTPTPPVCSGGSITLTGAVADTYLWTPGGATTQAITVTPTATTQYNITYGYGNMGCTRLDSANIVVGNTVTTAFAGNDTATCGTVITLAANTPVFGTGAWSQASGPGTITFGTPTSPTSTATASVNGSYKLYWTITAGAPCPGTSVDSVIVNFDAQPVANAGPDLTVCVSPGSLTLSAVAPTVGSGSWSFVSGPAAASIFPPPTNPNAGVVGMTVPGTYTFVWTVTNGVCAISRDTMVVVSNPSPSVPVITGGNVTVCQGTTVTLSGPVDPNYTYTWERALGSNGAAFSTVGTSQTLNTTVSGVFRLTVTNQFGCAATSSQSIVHIADYVFNGSIGAGDAQQTGRINRFGQVSTCAAPKACPGIFSATGARNYDSYQIINTQNVPVCATIGINSTCSTNVFMIAYLKTFDPSSTCTNYLADPGSSFTTGGFMEVTIPANDTIIIVVHEVNSGQGCANYNLTVNLPRDMSPIVVNPPTVTCASTATLTAPIADTYLWTPGGATTRSITTPPLFATAEYFVTLGYGNNGCTRLDSTEVVVTSAPPTVSCPANISLSNTTGQCGRAVTYTTTVGGTPTPTLTYTFTGATTGSGSGNGSGSFFAVGTTTVTVTATNACGSVNCSFTVTINDTEAPTVTTGSIGSCYPTVAAAQAAALAATSATDNCPGTLTEVASTVGTCSAVITITTTDVAGNATAITYNTRIDNTAPTVTIGSIGSCYPTVAAAEAAALVATSATDNCPGALTEVASTVGTCSAVITITTTDGCGKATSVTYNTRIDNTAPSLTCPIAITVCGTANIPVVDINTVTGVTDNCPGAITVTHQGDVVNAFSTTAPYTITRTYRATDGCGNFTECTQTITVNPIATVNTIANQVLCNTSATTAVNFTSPNTGGTIVYNWTNNTTSINLGVSGTGNIPSFTATNTTNAPIVATITVTPTFTNAGVSCVGTATTFTITVNPTPTVNAVTSQTLCNTAPSTAVNFSGFVPGTVYSWANTNTAIGLGGNGTGNIPSFTATNTTNAPISGTITVTPSYTNAGVTCTGTSTSFTVTVNPTATVNAVTNQVLCNTATTTAVNFSSPTTGGTIVYNWTNNTPAIGLAATGSGNIPTFTATNTTNAPLVATITVTPTYTNGVSCVGTPRTFTITVNPTPTVNAVANIAFCNAVASTPINFSGFVAGTVYTWTNSNTAIGLGAGGTGNIPSFTPTNAGTTPITSTVTVTPSFTNAGVTCTGASTSFVITVNPTTRIVTSPTNQTICFGSSTAFTASATGVNLIYQWQVNPGPGSAGSGFTNIPGAGSPTLNIIIPPSGLNFSGNRYRCVVVGTCGSDTSASALLTINPTPSVTLAASPRVSLLPGQTTSLAATATPPGGSYAWFYNDVLVSGASGAAFGPIGINNLGAYKVTYTDPNGCVGSSTALTIVGTPSSEIWVFPNPNNGQFNLRYYNQFNEQAKVQIYDRHGKLIYQENIRMGNTYVTTMINIKNQPAGYYLIQVINKDNVVLAAKRILIQP